MKRLVAQIQALVRELRRRQVIRVAVVYASAAFVILQLGEILVEPFGLGNWALRLVLFLLVLGFPLAIGLAWVYNITGEGVVREVEEAAGDEAAPEGTPEESPLTSNGLIVGLLIVAIGLLLYPRVFSSEESSGQGSSATADTAQVDERSVAVLPFTNLSGDAETRPVARGLHDDLLTRLSNVADLQVISRTSVEHYRDTDLPLPAIADSLGVRWIVEGGVQQAGGKIQVNAQLIDPESDVHRWADSYQRDFSAEDLFAIQGEIAREIAGALEAKLTAGEQDRLTGAPTKSLDAFQLYAQGRTQLYERTESGTRQALAYFRRAIRKDSTFAQAWAGLADALALAEGYGYQVAEGNFGPEEAARRALALDSTLAEAHATYGYTVAKGFEADRHYLRAIELNPSNPHAYHRLALSEVRLGRLDSAVVHLEQAVELDPMAAVFRGALSVGYHLQGRSEAALREIRRGKQLVGTSLAVAHLAEGWVLTGAGRHEAALAAFERGFERAPKTQHHRKTFAGWSGVVHARLGNRSRAEEIASGLGRDDEAPALKRSLIYAALGDRERGVTALARAAPETWGWISAGAFRYSPTLEPLRDTREYQSALRALNESAGLHPDGSVPDSVTLALGPPSDA